MPDAARTLRVAGVLFVDVDSWKASDFVVWDFHGEPKGSKPAPSQ